jgi:hypothetical protein
MKSNFVFITVLSCFYLVFLSGCSDKSSYFIVPPEPKEVQEPEKDIDKTLEQRKVLAKNEIAI